MVVLFIKWNNNVFVLGVMVGVVWNNVYNMFNKEFDK